MENNIEINVHRTNRLKTVSIQVLRGEVKISVPKNLEQIKIDKILKSKSKWIKKKLFLQSKIAPLGNKEYVSGESLLYLGRHYRLKIIIGKKYNTEFKDGYLKITVKNKSNKQKIKRLVKKWYLEKAQLYLNKMTLDLSKELGVSFNSVKVRNYNARWGSCSSTGKLFYNWRIIKAPYKIIKYVVLHELVHLKEHNHSKRFWKLLKSHYSNIDYAKQWLVYNGHTLTV